MEAGIDGVHAAERSHHQACADDEQHGEADFGADEEMADDGVARGTDAATHALAERVGSGGAAGPQHGRKAEEERGEQGSAERETQDGRINGDRRDVRQIRGCTTHDQPKQAEREADAEPTPREREHRGLGEELHGDASTAAAAPVRIAQNDHAVRADPPSSAVNDRPRTGAAPSVSK